jgi:hypothetical protein
MTRCSEVTDKQGNSVAFQDKAGGEVGLSDAAGASLGGWSIVGGRAYCETLSGFADSVRFGLGKELLDSLGLDDQATSQLTITVVEGDSLSLTDRGFESINFAESDDLAVSAKETLIKAGYGYGGYGRIGYGGKQTRAG